MDRKQKEIETENKTYKFATATKYISAISLALVCYLMLAATVFMGVDTAALVGIEF